MLLRAEDYALIGGTPTALPAEEYDPRAGRLVGNIPQAFSHIALIDGALTLAAGERGPARRRRSGAVKS